MSFVIIIVVAFSCTCVCESENVIEKQRSKDDHCQDEKKNNILTIYI
jgi:hypothetical protein